MTTNLPPATPAALEPVTVPPHAPITEPTPEQLDAAEARLHYAWRSTRATVPSPRRRT